MVDQAGLEPASLNYTICNHVFELRLNGNWRSGFAIPTRTVYKFNVLYVDFSVFNHVKLPTHIKAHLNSPSTLVAVSLTRGRICMCFYMETIPKWSAYSLITEGDGPTVS